MSSGDSWILLDGIWKESRDPTNEAIGKIDGEAQELGFVEFAGYTYAGILTYRPNYSEFLMDDRRQDHLEMKKSTEWAMQKDVGITVDNNTGDVEWKKSGKNMPAVGEEVGLLVLSGRYRGGALPRKVINE